MEGEKDIPGGGNSACKSSYGLSIVSESWGGDFARWESSALRYRLVMGGGKEEERLQVKGTRLVGKHIAAFQLLLV